MTYKDSKLTILSVLMVSARCESVKQLKGKDKYVRRYLASRLAEHNVTADSAPLEEWNEAIEIFGGAPENTPEKARERLLDLLDYKRGKATDAQDVRFEDKK